MLGRKIAATIKSLLSSLTMTETKKPEHLAETRFEENKNLMYSVEKSKINQKVDSGFRKRNVECLKQVFEKYWEEDVPVISKENLKSALEEFDIFIKDDEELDEFLETMDTSGDGVLDFEEFKRAVQYPGPIEQWAKTLPLAQLLSNAVPVQEDVDALRAVSRLSSADIELTCTAFAYGLKRIITEHVQSLRSSFEVRDLKAAHPDYQAAKFEVFTLSCGKIKDFHKGISGRVGELL